MPRVYDLMPMQSRVDQETGFLHAKIRPTRTGVFLYRKADGSILRALKHPEDVFDPDSLETLKRLVITRGHPKTKDGKPRWVDRNNVGELGVGHLGDTIGREHVAGQDHPSVWGTVTKGVVVDSITQNRRDMVSLGYEVEFDNTPGVYLGQPYDVRHINIRYNHCAVDIAHGRGGFTVAMALDEDDSFSDQTPKPTSRIEDDMHTIRIGNITVEVKDAQAGTIITDALSAKEAKIGELQGQITALTGQVDAQKKIADEADANLDQAKKDAADAKKKLEDAPPREDVREVISVIDAASEVLTLNAEEKAKLLDTEVPDGGTLVSAVRRHTVLTALEDEAEALSDKSDAYFEARFDALVSASKSEDGTRGLASALATRGKKPKGKSTDTADGEYSVEDIQKAVDESIALGDPMASTQLPGHAVSV